MYNTWPLIKFVLFITIDQNGQKTHKNLLYKNFNISHLVQMMCVLKLRKIRVKVVEIGALWSICKTDFY
jgi:hypothetical protein